MLNIFNKLEQNNESSKVIDSILGFVIADAIGVPAEFKSRIQLKTSPVKDMVGHGTHNQPEGTWSDDSSMTIATLDSINECGKIDYSDMMRKFYEWVSECKYTATGVFFDIGISTRNAINNYIKGVPPVQCGGTKVYENGNGSLMRILPIVLYSHSKELSTDEEVKLISEASSLTHGHEISKLGCKIYSDYVKSLLNGFDKKEALENLSFIDYSKYYSNESLKPYQRILNGSIKDLEENMIKSTGYVVDTLEASIWCIINSASYKEAVLKAVNLGDDTDTVGAITGSLAGIIYTYKNIPSKWIDKLKNKDYLIGVCKEFDKTLEKIKNNQKHLS